MFALVLSLSVAPSSALAQDGTDARAFELFTNGRDLYNEGRYEQAVLAFEEAYKLSGRHELLLNIANAHERNGKLEEALEALARYQAFAPSAERDQVERRKTMLEKKLADQQATSEPAPAPEPAPQPVAPVPAPAPQPAPVQRSGGGLSGQVLLGGAMVGLGAASVGTGVALGVVSSGAKKRATENCTDFEGSRLCSGEAQSEVDQYPSTD